MDFIDGINTDINGDIQICSIADYYCTDINTAKELSISFENTISKQSFTSPCKYFYEYIEKEQKARYTFLGTPLYISKITGIIESEWNRIHSSLSKFSVKAKNYNKYRPSYPEAAIDFIFKIAGKHGLTIADIGSGTGKMSELLLRNGNTIYAVEPNAEMRNEAELKLGEIGLYHSINATAENSTLNADSIDIIICAEAYHWFDNENTIVEFKRILKTEGYVFLLWNTPGDSPYSKDMDKLYQDCCKLNQIKELKVTKDELAVHLFGEGQFIKIIFDNTIHESYEALLGGALSASFAPEPDNENYNEFITGIKTIFDKYSKDKLIETQFKTVCYYGRL